MLPVDEPRGAAAAVAASSFQRLLLDSLQVAIARALRGASIRATREALKRVMAAIGESDTGTALKYIDRAWRCIPEDSAAIATVYARLHALESADHDATLRLLERVTVPDSDIAALAGRTLLALDRLDEARLALNVALADFCVVPGRLLEWSASQYVQHPAVRVPGWIARASNLEYVGVLVGEDLRHALDIKLDSGAEFVRPIKSTVQGGRQTFHCTLPDHIGPDAVVTILARAVPLLGSGCRARPPFKLDGRADSSGRRVHGWTRLQWHGDAPLQLSITDEHDRRIELKTPSESRSHRGWHFSVDLERQRIRGNRLEIAARLPDGSWQPLPDAPLLLAPALRLSGPSAPLTRWRPLESSRASRRLPARTVGLDIIIPVYRGRRSTLACIDAVLATLIPAARVIVVDDATQDRALAAELDALQAAGKIVLLRNATNRGFVGSVNRALARSRSRDAVLLNSDTRVFGDWLTRLKATAYGAARVGTVTPFSNSGSIASYPRSSEDPMSTAEAAVLHALAAATQAGASVEIPVGVGFCLYIRRDCLEDTGMFDEAVFGKGYGEETDFCLRARRRGWSHRLAADVFVYHSGGRSFGTRREALLHRSQRLINLRHPGYSGFIADFETQDPAAPLRRRLDAERVAALPGRFVLLVSLALPGGVARFVADRSRALRAQGLTPLVLRPHRPGDTGRCEISTDSLDVPNLQYDIPGELDALVALLRRLTLERIEIQHFLHLDPRVIDAVRRLEVPYEFVVHDYALICPRVTLIDGTGRFCGEPAVTDCEACVKRNGSVLRERISVTRLRERSAVWLREAARVVVPSADTAQRLKRYFPLEMTVVPHAPPALPAPGAQPGAPAPVRRPREDGRVRVAVLGAIGRHKGFDVLLECALDATARTLPLEFVVIGYTEDDAKLLRTGKVFVTGRYADGEALPLMRREAPDLTLLPSVYPETWCYALDEALAAAVPIVAFDLGAVGERLRGLRVGTLLPPRSSAAEINDRLLRLASQTLKPPSAEMAMIQRSEEKTLNRPSVGALTAPKSLSASVQVLPLSAGLYLFSVQTAPDATGQSLDLLQRPALHVGLGPGVLDDQVEFISGPATGGTWLFAQHDCLVTKIRGGGVTLVLTSVRGPAGETLSIKIERLDGRGQAAPPLAAAAAPDAAPADFIARPDGAARPDAARAGPVAADGAADALPLTLIAHVRTRGDMTFANALWAGPVGPGLWIESFAIRPEQQFAPEDIEYKGLTGSGFETPWLSDGAMCGTKGMGVPLVGFAIRLKPSPAAAAFDCEYSGYFKSGLTAGPQKNGAPCRSAVANDPLEGIQVQIRKRVGAPAVAAPADVPAPAPLGPSFGRYRDEVATEPGSMQDMKPNRQPQHEASSREQPPDRRL
jgi:GT2 family glycosyltransferase/glycosyltransferase involved in cell wall biosynthesis